MSEHPPDLKKPEEQALAAEKAESAQEASSTEVRLAMSRHLRIGPLPPPDDLQEYESVMPGAADRIITMAELCIAHQQRMGEQQAKRDSRHSLLGVCSGLLVTILVVGLSSWLVNNGHGIYGTVLASTNLVSLVAVFVVGSKRQ
ncbi:DUF2335 domain-containing protein [Candidatus Poriferisocius sp.]|uniref:DUF2335 domain-containing protein n=1 Tax=Candidatus Poriferisocius sp. TaxID=3101276 RepID=UPI003B021D50